MLYVRAALSILMIVLGAFVVVEMLRFPIAQSFTGIVLGGAMVFLGILRIRQVREALRQR